MRALLVILILALLGFGSNKLKLRKMGSDLGSSVRRVRRILEGASATPGERVESTGPDAEFPEVTDPDRLKRKGG